jgi:GNAT superfamily N-acetyltransferase
VDTLAVRSDRRRRGVGHALMAAAHGWTQERRLGQVSLNVWEGARGAAGLGPMVALRAQSPSGSAAAVALPGSAVAIWSGQAGFDFYFEVNAISFVGTS